MRRRSGRPARPTSRRRSPSPWWWPGAAARPSTCSTPRWARRRGVDAARIRVRPRLAAGRARPSGRRRPRAAAGDPHAAPRGRHDLGVRGPAQPGDGLDRGRRHRAGRRGAACASKSCSATTSTPSRRRCRASTAASSPSSRAARPTRSGTTTWPPSGSRSAGTLPAELFWSRAEALLAAGMAGDALHSARGVRRAAAPPRLVHGPPGQRTGAGGRRRAGGRATATSARRYATDALRLYRRQGHERGRHPRPAVGRPRPRRVGRAVAAAADRARARRRRRPDAPAHRGRRGRPAGR